MLKRSKQSEMALLAQLCTVSLFAAMLLLTGDAYFAVALDRPLSASQNQNQRNRSDSTGVPRVRKSHLVVCGANDWEVGRIILSKETGTLLRLDLPDPIAAIPPDVAPKLSGYRAAYNFEWDDQNLYANVQVREPVVDSRYPDIPANAFLGRSAAGFFPDMLYDSVVLVVEDSTSQSARYTTEMHLFVRAPGARAPQWTFFGRTVAQEDFHDLAGKAVACPSSGGYTVTFSVAWLPSDYWQPKVGARASVRMLAPLPGVETLSLQERSRNAYLLARMLDVTLEP